MKTRAEYLAALRAGVAVVVTGRPQVTLGAVRDGLRAAFGEGVPGHATLARTLEGLGWLPAVQRSALLANALWVSPPCASRSEARR
jgi:hypothetical protein